MPEVVLLCAFVFAVLYKTMADNKRLRSAVSTDEDGEQNESMASMASMATSLAEMMSRLAEVRQSVRDLVVEVRGVAETVKEIREKLDKHEDILVSLREKVDRNAETISVVKVKVETSERQFEGAKKAIDGYRERMERLEERIIDQEARSRRNNLIFHGVQEKEGENCEQVVRELFRTCRLEGNPVIERAHRIGKVRGGSVIGRQTGRSRPLIVRFLDFNDRQKVREVRKHLPQSIYVTDDLPREIREARQKLLPELNEVKRAGRQAWLAYPARLIVEGKEVKSVRPKQQQREERA